MARIFGIDLPKDKRIEAALPYIYGIGPKRSRDILDEAQISYDKRSKDLSDEEVAKITSIIQSHYTIEGELRQEVAQNIRRLIDASSYRGYRHKRGLPVRGQRTKTNARTRKGKRRSAGAAMARPTK